MTEVLKAIEPKTQNTQSNIDQINTALEGKNKEMKKKIEELNKKIWELKDLQEKNTENTKELLSQLQSEINEYKEEIETLKKEIINLQWILKKTSDNLRKSADGIDAVLTSSISPEQKKDKTPKTPTQTSSDSISNQAPTDSSQLSTAQQPPLSSTESPSQDSPQTSSSNQAPEDPSQSSTAQKTSSSTELSTQEKPKNEEDPAPKDPLSNEKQGDNAKSSTPETPSQVTSDGQNTPQEQVPQTVPTAPVVQPKNTQPAQQPEVAPQQAPQIETQPQLTDAQKLAQVQQILGNIESKFISLQAESNSITLTAAELASLDQASNLLQQSPVSLSTADQRALLINDEDVRNDYIKKLEDQIKKEKKARRGIERIKELEEKLAQVSNHNNYNLNVMNSLSGINSVLQNGTYLDAKFQIPREQKFALELIKKRDLLRSWAVVPLTIDGRTVEVYNGAFVGQALQTWLRIDNCNQPVNIVEKLLVDHTKMSLDQARSATKTITTIGVLAGAFYGLKWLLGNTDKEGNRSFGLSPKKFLGAAVVLLGGNMASQMATGRGALDLINEFWRTGNNPFTSATYEKAQPIEQISLDQTALQMALLGVPYAQLSQFTSPKSWPISSIDLVSLQRYYEAQMLIAKQNQLNDKIQQIGTQISAIKDIINNPNATQLLNQNLANMNIQAQELANPENAGLTLDDLLYQNSNNRKILEKYMETNNLIIAPWKKDELMSKIIAKWTVLTDPIMVSLKDDGLLIPNIPENAEIAKLNLTPDQKQALEEAFRNLSKKSEFKNIQLSALSDQEIKLKSDSGEIVLNAKTLTIPGLVNSAGQELQMQNHEELLHIGLFINQTKAKFWNEIPDRTKKQDKDGRPFAQPHGRNNFTAWQGIIFKGALSTKEVLNSTIPSWDDMNDYPTIEKGDGRDFLINYLNTQWKKDHPSKYNPTVSEKK